MNKPSLLKLIISCLVVFAVFAIPVVSSAANNVPKGKTLEIVYPQIPGVVTPTTTATGLPDYVIYIFNFAVFIIGFIIFLVLIYNGFKILTSAGKPDIYSDAKDGIYSAILGAIILLGSFILFKTINPQLVELKLPDPAIVEPVVTSGIYICDYDVNSSIGRIFDPKNLTEEEKNLGVFSDINISDVSSLPAILDLYINGPTEENVILGAKALKLIMKNKQGHCARVGSSGNLQDFVFKNKRNSIFSVPTKFTDSNGKPATRYDYGIILHEKEGMRGMCKFISDDNKGESSPYMEILNTDLGFASAKSITIFQKLNHRPDENYKGVILYDCLDYNSNESMCPQNQTREKDTNKMIVNFTPIRPDLGKNYIKMYFKLDSDGNIEKGQMIPRSIKIDPEGSFFAILYSGANYDGNICDVVSKSTNNLLDREIGGAGNFSCRRNWYGTQKDEQQKLTACNPLMKSLIVVEGKVL